MKENMMVYQVFFKCVLFSLILAGIPDKRQSNSCDIMNSGFGQEISKQHPLLLEF